MLSCAGGIGGRSVDVAKLYLCALGFLLTAPWIGTQYIAHHYHFAKWLGVPMLTVFSYHVYMPLSVFGWLWKYTAADPAPCDTALILMALVAVPWALLALWIKRASARPQTFGTQDWGNRRDMRKAGLFSDVGPIIGRVGKRYVRYKGPMA
jgi:type IV secretory pathway TraG/TraD family ATPase VirD4